MRQCRLLAEQEAAGGQTVAQRETLDGQGAVFVDDLMNGGVDRIELHLVAQVMAEELYLLAKHIAQRLGTVDVECCRAPQ